MGAGTTIGFDPTTTPRPTDPGSPSPIDGAAGSPVAAVDDDPAATGRPSRRRWIVGVDGSETSAHAVEWVALNAPGRADEVRLLRAWQMPAASYCDPAVMIPPTLPREVEDAARRDVDEQVDALDLPDEVDAAATTVMSGSASALLDAADDADLLVIGSRGRGGFGRLLLGSTSHQVATHAPVPTVVVPPDGGPARRPARIVVGVDGSPNSLAALDWALRFADPDATVEVVMVWDVAPLLPGSEQFVYPEETDLGAERLALLCRRAVERSGRTDVRLRERYVNGSSRNELHDAAARADLLVTGTRGHGAVGSAILGSVSTWLLHHLVTPMVVVPHDD